jgi:hypothetical protein
MNIGCLLSGILSLVPRLVLIFMWFFSDQAQDAIEGIFIPILGFLFLPFTTMAYILVWNPQSGVSGSAWIIVIGGLLFDIGTYALSRYANRLKIQSSPKENEAT